MAITFWTDKKQNRIDPKLYSEQAETMAKNMREDHNGSRKKPNKRTQLRKFYDEVVRLDAEARKIRDIRLPEEEEKWAAILPMIHMLAAKAAYAEGRELVSENFSKFIKFSVGQIEDPRDLRVFANFFEAFMGYYRLHGPRN